MLARVLYSEARCQSRYGKLAVAQVVLNRLESSYYGNTLKEILTAANQFAPLGGTSYGLRLLAYQALSGERFAEDYVLLYFRRTTSTSDWFAPFLFHVGVHAFYGFPRHKD